MGKGVKGWGKAANGRLVKARQLGGADELVVGIVKGERRSDAGE